MHTRTPINMEMFDSLPPDIRNTEFRHEIKRVRKETASWLRTRIKDNGYQFNEVSRAVGSDVTAFSRMLSTEFTVPFEGIRVLCEFYLNCTCCELLLADNWNICVPGWLAAVLREYGQLSDDAKSYASSIIDEYKAKSESLPQTMTSGELTYHRINEYCDYHNILMGQLVVSKESRYIRPGLLNMIQNKAFTARLSTFIYLCCLFHTSPDFFLESDYSHKSDLYMDDNGEKKSLTKEETKLVSEILKVNYDLQIELAGKILALGF